MASKEVIKQKEAEVSELAEKLKDAKLILLVDYRGITVDGVNTLRKELRQTDADYMVIKNNITKRALNANNETGLDEILEGPTAIVIGKEDFLSPLKAIYKFSKVNEYYNIKGGIVEGKILSIEELVTLAMLPSREELLSKLAGALLGTISKLAVGLNEVQKLKSEGTEVVEKKEEKDESTTEDKAESEKVEVKVEENKETTEDK